MFTAALRNMITLFIRTFIREGQPRVVLTAALEYNNLFMTASATEGHPRVLITAALRNIINFS